MEHTTAAHNMLNHQKPTQVCNEIDGYEYTLHGIVQGQRLDRNEKHSTRGADEWSWDSKTRKFVRLVPPPVDTSRLSQ